MLPVVRLTRRQARRHASTEPRFPKREQQYGRCTNFAGSQPARQRCRIFYLQYICFMSSTLGTYSAKAASTGTKRAPADSVREVAAVKTSRRPISAWSCVVHDDLVDWFGATEKPETLVLRIAGTDSREESFMIFSLFYWKRSVRLSFRVGSCLRTTPML